MQLVPEVERARGWAGTREWARAELGDPAHPVPLRRFVDSRLYERAA